MNNLAPASAQTVAVHRCDRRSIQRRLHELDIACHCPTDGTLRVEVTGAVSLVLVCSTLRQFSCKRCESVDWLDRCWHTDVGCSVNN